MRNMKQQCSGAGSLLPLFLRAHEINVGDPKGRCKLVEGDDRGVASSALKAAQILLTETGSALDLLLRHAFVATNTRKVLSHKLAHVHLAIVPRRLGLRYQL